MTRQEFGAALFIAFSILTGAVILLLQHTDTGFLPDLVVYEASNNRPVEHTSSSGIPVPSSVAVDEDQSSRPVSLNAATLTDLQKLKGIGPELARRIMAYRAQIGAYSTLKQLLEVKGIGPAKLARLAPFVTLP